MTDQQPTQSPELDLHHYRRPNGEHSIIPLTDLDPEDANFFLRHSVVLSIEEAGSHAPGYIIYGDTGLLDPEGEPIEEIVFTQGRSARDSFAELAQLCRQHLEPSAKPTKSGDQS